MKVPKRLVEIQRNFPGSYFANGFLHFNRWNSNDSELLAWIEEKEPGLKIFNAGRVHQGNESVFYGLEPVKITETFNDSEEFLQTLRSLISSSYKFKGEEIDRDRYKLDWLGCEFCSHQCLDSCVSYVPSARLTLSRGGWRVYYGVGEDLYYESHLPKEAGFRIGYGKCLTFVQAVKELENNGYTFLEGIIPIFNLGFSPKPSADEYVSFEENLESSSLERFIANLKGNILLARNQVQALLKMAQSRPETFDGRLRADLVRLKLL